MPELRTRAHPIPAYRRRRRPRRAQRTRRVQGGTSLAVPPCNSVCVTAKHSLPHLSACAGTAHLTPDYPLDQPFLKTNPAAEMKPDQFQLNRGCPLVPPCFGMGLRAVAKPTAWPRSAASPDHHRSQRRSSGSAQHTWIRCRWWARKDRLVVACIVTMEERRFHNRRIFVRNRKPRESDADPERLILAWVNEPLP